MSIAVSVKLNPSNIFRITSAAMAGLLCCLSFYIGYLFWLIDETLLGLLSALICLAFTFLLFKKCFVECRLQIDISADGSLIMREISAVSPVARPFSLGCQTTLWSKLLFLHIVGTGVRPYFVVIMPDSVDGISFRALSVGVRWIIAHQGGRSRNFLPGTELL